MSDIDTVVVDSLKALDPEWQRTLRNRGMIPRAPVRAYRRGVRFLPRISFSTPATPRPGDVVMHCQTSRAHILPRAGSDVQRSIHNRILAVTAIVLRDRHGVSKEVKFSPDLADVVDVIKHADATQLRLLKEGAEDLRFEYVSADPPSEVH